MVRVGGRHEIPVDVRVISATNVSLSEAIKAGRFREDLYWRLTGVELRLPPLRERREDIPVLRGQFAQHFAAEFGVEPPEVRPGRAGALHGLAVARERARTAERIGALTALCAGGMVHLEDLPPEMRSTPPAASAAPSAAVAPAPAGPCRPPPRPAPGPTTSTAPWPRWRRAPTSGACWPPWTATGAGRPTSWGSTARPSGAGSTGSRPPEPAPGSGVTASDAPASAAPMRHSPPCAC